MEYNLAQARRELAEEMMERKRIQTELEQLVRVTHILTEPSFTFIAHHQTLVLLNLASLVVVLI